MAGGAEDSHALWQRLVVESRESSDAGIRLRWCLNSLRKLDNGDGSFRVRHVVGALGVELIGWFAFVGQQRVAAICGEVDVIRQCTHHHAAHFGGIQVRGRGVEEQCFAVLSLVRLLDGGHR